MKDINFNAVLVVYKSIGQRISAYSNSRQYQFGQALLFVFGVSILCFGIFDNAVAQRIPPTYNDDRIAEATNIILTYIEGSFGALVMVVAGLGAILGAAFGQYRAALGLLVVAVGSFILRSIVGTFFNDSRIRP
jgi:hypothetical protein